MESPDALDANRLRRVDHERHPIPLEPTDVDPDVVTDLQDLPFAQRLDQHSTSDPTRSQWYHRPWDSSRGEWPQLGTRATPPRLPCFASPVNHPLEELVQRLTRRPVQRPDGNVCVGPLSVGCHMRLPGRLFSELALVVSNHRLEPLIGVAAERSQEGECW